MGPRTELLGDEFHAIEVSTALSCSNSRSINIHGFCEKLLNLETKVRLHGNLLAGRQLRR